MSCKQFHDALTEAALGVAQNARLVEHLAGCGSCRAELERLRALAGAMDRRITEMVDVEPSPGFAARVRAQVAKESAARAAWWRGWVPALAGGVAVLALVAWLVWPDAQRPTSPGAPEMVKGEPVAPLRAAPEAPDKSVAPTPAEPQRQEVAAVRKSSVPVRPPRETPARPALPEVLVSGDEWNQVLKLYALAQQGRVNTEAVALPDAIPLEQKFAPMVIAQLQPIPPLGESSPPSEPRK